MNINEANWVALARSGDRGALHELYERHRSRIFALAYRYVKNVPDAEDILQDTFIKAFQSLQKCQLDESSYFSTWLYRIGVNCAMDHFRRQRRLDEALVTLPPPTGVVRGPLIATTSSLIASRVSSGK